ncbi:MAG: glutamine amidotransferase [Planctomycetota bacterium]
MSESWVLQPVINPIAIAVVIGFALMLLLVGPSFGGLSGVRRFQLTMIRLAVIGLALVALLRPGCVQKIEKNQSAVLLFLIDETRSMELPHQSDDSTRWGAMLDALEENRGRIEQLREKEIEVRFFSFDNEVRALEEVDGELSLPARPAGGETDIGTAIFSTSQDVRDQRVIGMVLGSDGVQNVTNPEVELTRAADTLHDMEVPLWAMAFGLPGDAGQLSDVAVKNFPEQLSVNVKNRLVAKATVVARNYMNQDITVQLVLRKEDGSEEVVNTTSIRPASSLEEQQVEMEYVPTEPGEYRLLVRAVAQPDEVALRNNELPAFLSVSDRGMRVLFLVGRLNWEQNALIRTIPSASEGIQLDVRQIFPRNQMTYDPAIGAELRRLFSDPTYDVFIIGDVDSRAMHQPGMRDSPLEALAEAVQGGKGLMMLGGFHTFGAGMYHQTPLEAIIPVRMDPGERQDFGQDIRRDLHITRNLKLRPVVNHFLTTFTIDSDGNDNWRELPELVGANRIVPKQNSLVMLETDDVAGNPIMVIGDVGGRVLAFAGDSTWRWITRGRQDEFDRFWRQIILWLAYWDGKTDESISIEMPQRRFQPMGLVKFNVSARSDTESLENIEYQANLIHTNGRKTPVTINRSGAISEGQLEREAISDSGDYKLEVTGTVDGRVIGRSEREFIVVDRDKEKSNPAADPEQMMRLASETAEFGGRALTPAELGDLLDDIIANPPKTQMEIPVKWQLGETFGDAAGFLSLFVTLLAVEWILRKKWGLV